MGFLKRIFSAGSDGSGDADGSRGAREEDVGMLTASDATFDANADRQRVTVWLRLRDPSFENEREQQRVFALENAVMRALDGSGVGEHDTNSLETSYFAMRLYGEEADAIVEVISPLLVDAPPGSYLAVRRGGGHSAEDRVGIGAGVES